MFLELRDKTQRGREMVIVAYQKGSLDLVTLVVPEKTVEKCLFRL